MTRILGLDLGTNSIGWAVVEKEKDNKTGSIIGTGVRIFPAGIEEKTIGKGEKEMSKNAVRREKRQSRRQFYRKKLRKIKLLQLLIEQGMCPLSIEELNQWKNWNNESKSDVRVFPNSNQFIDWIKLNPYYLRNKAINEAITLFEFGRILYHFIQRRGFLSSRKGKEDSTIFTKGKPKENILSINETKEKIENRSFGEYLYSISYKEKEPFKIIIDEVGKRIKPRGRYTLREMYIQEFENIWVKQNGNLKLDEKKTTRTKRRKLKGDINSKLNQQKLKYLKAKYGDKNVYIEECSRNNEKSIVTKQCVSLKEALVGEIHFDENDIKFNSNESVLFWQRPLRSQKSLIADCRFESKMPVINKKGQIVYNNSEIQYRSKKPCYLSHPEFELFRAWQLINNIKFGKNYYLNQEQKGIVFNYINAKDKAFNFSEIPKLLNLAHEQFNYDDNFKFQGNTTIKLMTDLFKKDVFSLNYVDLWHCFMFYEDNDMLYEKLIKDFGLQSNTVNKDKIEKINFKEGYSSVSLKAIRNILPFLEWGYQYDKAVILGGVKNAFGNRWGYFDESHQNICKDVYNILIEDNAEGEAIEKIKEYLAEPNNHYGFAKDDVRFNYLYHHSQPIEIKDGEKGKLDEVENMRNPIVQKALGETRRLVNYLLNHYKKEHGPNFKFDRICVELGRDLKVSKERRQEMQRMISDNERKNEEARQRLAEYGLKPSRENVHKYLLYKEIEDKANGPVICPYTGKVVSVNALLGSKNIFQIEHIIPYSISLDDSFGNKTICESNFNRDKGEKTPYQFHCENPDKSVWGANSWEEVESRAFKCLPYVKAKKFTAKKDFVKDTFIERQLNDTRYVAKKAKELLTGICKDVRVMPGQLTAELRHLWGLNNILQPIQNIDISKSDFSKDDNFPCFVIKNNSDNVNTIVRKYNNKPQKNQDEILIEGRVEKSKFKSNIINTTIAVENFEDGKYWLKLKLKELKEVVKINIDKPAIDDSFIVLRGRIEKYVFINETLKQKIKTNNADGYYWASFKINSKKFVMPEKANTPDVKRGQILLYGVVKDEVFKSYIYECPSNMPNGKYWLIIDVNINEVSFLKARNERPQIKENQIVLSGTIDDEAVFVADIDKDFLVNTERNKGRYYFVYDYLLNGTDLYLIENNIPKKAMEQEVIEGNIWVDKYTGEIKFDPKKNREDQRHHSIDAITIACTEQSFLQRLSMYNAKLKDKERAKPYSTEHFHLPWDSFYKDVKASVESILVSYHKKNKVFTKNKKGYSVRGQLHKESVYGEATGKDSVFHIREKLTDLKNHKHVSKIVDNTIRDLLEKHLEKNFNINTKKDYKIPEDAFFKDGKPLLFLPNTGKRRKDGKIGEPVPILKVRVKEYLGNAKKLKSNIKQYVNPRNNHHVIIFEKGDGTFDECVVSFWEALERQRKGFDLYKLPDNCVRKITTLEANDLFLLGLSESDFYNYRTDYSLLSKYLYRVEAVSSKYYEFRHHLESSQSREYSPFYYIISSLGYGKKGWQTFNPIKVKINLMGQIIIENRI